MRRASSSRLTSPSTEEAVPPAFAICSTRLSTPPQFVSRSPGALCSLATPAGRRSETTTATPLAASARAVELPMPIGLPQPVIKATRVGWGIRLELPFDGAGDPHPNPPPLAREGTKGGAIFLGTTLADANLELLPPPQAGEGRGGGQTGRVPFSCVRCIRRRVAGSNASRRCIAQRL